jgi:4-diphosphocytidyl-2-C-methyl-D-erythritol kinase
MKTNGCVPLRLEAPCKLNLHLSVGEKRPDGFHGLESLFALVEFGDTLEFSPENGESDKTSLEISPQGPFGELLPPPGRAESILGPPEQNLIYRAAALFRSAASFHKDLRVDLIKRVPPGSGLGGGSSDAAAALLALNSLAGEPLGPGELLSLGEKLGSDVPFFLHRAPAAWVSGRGEMVEPLEALPPLPVLLVFPRFSSNTGEAFALLDASRGSVPLRNNSKEELIAALGKTPDLWPFGNDFLGVFGDEKSGVYSSILKELRIQGALFSGLSGSGSACFAVFPPEKDLQKVKIPPLEGIIGIQNTFFLAH